MGVVWEGENVRIRRRVAVKILRAQLTTMPESVQRFEREAQAAARIGSDHIVEVLDLGDLPDGSRYLVMEYLEGQSLQERLRAGAMSPQAAVRIAIQTLEGLGRAHEAGIVHRDIKPENVFLLRRKDADHVKIVDFGISKFADATAANHALTKTGALLGTPAYMAPEQMRGATRIDHRADLYSVGTILFECIAGEHPFEFENTSELMFKVGLESARDIRDVARHVDPELAEILRKALAREPDDRYPNAYEMYRLLVSWLERHPTEGPAVVADEETRQYQVRVAHGGEAPPTSSAALGQTAYAPGHVSPAAMQTIIAGETSASRAFAPPTHASPVGYGQPMPPQGQVMIYGPPSINGNPVSAMASTPRAHAIPEPAFPHDPTLGSHAGGGGSVALKAVIAAASVFAVGGAALLAVLHFRGAREADAPPSSAAVEPASAVVDAPPPPAASSAPEREAPPVASVAPAPPASVASVAAPPPAAAAGGAPPPVYTQPGTKPAGKKTDTTPGGRVFRKDL